jgi:hypothetical protein
MRHLPILARCAYAAAASAAVAANNSFISFFNDSSAAQVLALRDFGLDVQLSASIEGFVIARQKIGANPVQGSSVYTSQGSMPGQLLTGSVAANPAFSLFASGNTFSPGWPHEFPIVVLAPGWSITAYATTQNAALILSFWWEWMFPAQLLNPDIGPEHIDHARGY